MHSVCGAGTKILVTQSTLVDESVWEMLALYMTANLTGSSSRVLTHSTRISSTVLFQNIIVEVFRIVNTLKTKYVLLFFKTLFQSKQRQTTVYDSFSCGFCMHDLCWNLWSTKDTCIQNCRGNACSQYGSRHASVPVWCIGTANKSIFHHQDSECIGWSHQDWTIGGLKKRTLCRTVS